MIFKLWKSYGGLARIAGQRRERVLYELYAKMIGLILTLFILAPWRMPQGIWANCEASPFKVRDILQRFAWRLLANLSVWDQLRVVLGQLFTHMARFGFKQKRQKQPNLCHALALAFPVYVLDVDLDQALDLPVLLA